MAETDSVRPGRKLSRDDYTIGWICALSIELAASAGMLDVVHQNIGLARGDKNMYTLGEIAGHNIAIACLPEGSTGIVPAATVASNMLRSFPKIRFGLMVGIGGGAPARRARPSEDIRLGDVVVSIPQKELGGVIKYDRGKLIAGGEFEHTGLLNMPPSPLTNAVSKLRSIHESKRSAVSRYVASMIGRVMASEDANPEFGDQYSCLDTRYDQLFEADYEHIERPESLAKDESPRDGEGEEGKEREETDDEDEDEEPLSDGDEDEIPLPCPHCDKSRLVARKPRKFPGPVIHYGTIASADQVMRHGPSREKIRKKYGVLCFEMEAAGLMNDFPCLVVRGICDYSDTHKHKIWQRYAAATAAAYAKELLQVVLKDEIELTEDAARVLEKMEQGINDIGEGVEYLVNDRQQRNRDRILDWLDKDTHTKKFIDSYEKWQPSTVQKLLGSDNYVSWSSGDCQTLWCHGMAGGGKTIFASVVVDTLKTAQAREPHRRPRAGVVCLFIEYERQQEQTVRSLTSAILRQLSEQCDVLPSFVIDLFDEYGNSTSHIRFEDLSLALTNIMRQFSQVFLIVDALDECTDNTRKELLAHLSDQQKKTGLRILATSRTTIDFQRDFGPCEEMEVKADVVDVKTVLNLVIDKSDSLVKTDEELRHRVTESIAVAVDGMFLLVQPFLDSIIGERSRGHIEDSLNTLMESPDKLSTVYQGALNRIGGQKPGDCRLAHRMLSWVVQSKRPLTCHEFLHALAIKTGNLTFKRDYIIHNLDDAVALCAGLVVINQRSDTVQLMHHTARTYFEDPAHRPEWMDDSEEMIASACITYVSYTIFEDGPCEYDEDLDDRLLDFPFLPYAARHWGDHARDGRAQTPAMEDLALNFLRDKDKLASANQAMQVTERRYHGYSARYDDDVTGLHIVASFGLTNLAKQLLSDIKNVDVTDRDGRTALHRAAENGHNDVVAALLKHGANVDAEEDTGSQTALHIAALNGHKAVVQTLIRNGASSKAKDADGWMAIHVTAWTGNEDVMRILLETTDVDARTDDELTALHCAAAQGHSNIAQLLIRTGANVDAKDEDKWTPLHWASKKRHDVMRPRMLSLKDDSSTLLRQFYEFKDEVNHLVMNEGIATVKKTLDFWQNKLAWLPAGIELNVDGGGEYGNIMAALQMTSNIQSVVLPGPAWGDIWVNVLGDQNRSRRRQKLAQDKKDKPPPPTRFIFAIQDELTAMHCSTECGHEAVARLLIKNGADIEERCLADVEIQWLISVQSHPTGLHLAAFSGHEAMVRLLLKQGADLEARTDFPKATSSRSSRITPRAAWTALHCGVVSGSEEVVQLLLDHGADMRQTCPVEFLNMNCEVTPLHVAIMLGHMSQVRILLANGIDVDAMAHMTLKPGRDSAWDQSRRFSRSPGKEERQEAEQHEEDNKKIMIPPGRMSVTPLQLSAVLARDDIMATLIENQANVEARLTVWIGSAEVRLTVLHVAVIRRCESAARLLLEHGADPRRKMSIRNDSDDGVHTRAEMTPLHLTALRRDEGLPDLLLKAGADVNELLRIDVKGWRSLGLDAENETKEKAKDGTTRGKDRAENEDTDGDEDEEQEKGGWVEKFWDRFITRTKDNFAVLLGDELADFPILGSVVQGMGKKNSTVYDMHASLPLLALATLRINIDVVRVSLSHGAAVNAESLIAVNKASVRFTALHLAALIGSTSILHELLDAGADVHAVLRITLGNKLDMQVTALQLAAISGSREPVQLLLDSGSDVGKQCLINNDPNNVLTALHFAALWGRQGAFSALIEAEADPTQTCQLKLSPVLDVELSVLHLAAISGNTSIVKTLLATKGDDYTPARLDCYKLHAVFTVLHLAAMWGQEAVIEELLGHGQDLHAMSLIQVKSHTRVDLPVLHLAAFAGSIPAVDKLIEAGADVLQKVLIHGEEISTELTVLHIAAFARQKEMVGFLLESPGIDLHASVFADVYGMQVSFTLLHLMVLWTTEMTALLLNKEFNVDARFLIEGEDTYTEFTALHLAVALGKKRLALLLLNHGADTNVRAQIVTDDVNIDLTALHMAVAWRSIDLVQMLTSTDPIDRNANLSLDSDSAGGESLASSENGSFDLRRRCSPSSSYRSRSWSRSTSGPRLRARTINRSPSPGVPNWRRERAAKRSARRERSRIRLASRSPSTWSRSGSRTSSSSSAEEPDSRIQEQTQTPFLKNIAGLSSHPFAKSFSAAAGIRNWKRTPSKRRMEKKKASTRPVREQSSSAVSPDRAASEMAMHTEQIISRTSVADTTAVLFFNIGGIRVQLTALHMAAVLFKEPQMMQLLLKGTANPGVTLKAESAEGDSLQLTPLHLAVLRMSTDVVKCLVGAGADIETVLRLNLFRFYAEISPLQMVAVSSHWEMAQFFLGHHASAKTKHPFAFGRELQADIRFWLVVALSSQAETAGLLRKAVAISAKAPATIHALLHSEVSAFDIVDEHLNEDIRSLFAHYGHDLEESDVPESKPWIRKAIFLILLALSHNKTVTNLALTNITNIDDTATVNVRFKVDATFGTPMEEGVEVMLNVDVGVTLSGLHVVACLGKVNMASVLIERGASVESRCEIVVGDMMRAQLSAIHLAALWKRTAMIQLLLENGASVQSVANVYVERAVRAAAVAPHLAAVLGHDRISRLLLQHEDDNINIKIQAELTPIHFAVLTGDTASTVALLERHEKSVEATCLIHVQAKTTASRLEVDLQAQFMPIHLATFAGHPRVIATLLDMGARIDAPMQLGGKAAIERPARVSRKIQANGTALHLAASLGKEDIVQFLIENGANVHLRSHDGRTAQEWAEDHGHDDVVQLLAQAKGRDGGKSERRRLREKWYDIFAKGDLNNSLSDDQSLEQVGQDSMPTHPKVYRQEGLGNVFTRWIAQKVKEKQNRLQRKETPEDHVDEEID